MGKLVLDITMSLDGYVAGPDPRPDEPLGTGGEALHEWVFGLESWRRAHGMEGGTAGADDQFIEAMQDHGAVLMGRGMFGGGPGPWDEQEPWNGWWGDDPPFKGPVFVLTSHPRETLHMQHGKSFTFVSDGIESALAQAQAAAGDKKVHLAGGADIAQQYLAAGLLDEIQLHISPLLLGGGVRLFEKLGDPLPKLEPVQVVESPAVTHVRYRVVK